MSSESPAVIDGPQQDETTKSQTLALASVDSGNPEPLSGYELVADMMRRQDEVIAELDSLNEKIESVIQEISAARKLEQEAELAIVSVEDLPVETPEPIAQPFRNAA